MTLANGHHKSQTLRPRYIGDPYRYRLTDREKSIIGMLTDGVRRSPFKSEAEWRKFTSAFVYDTNAIEGSHLTRGEVARLLHFPNGTADKEEREALDIGRAVSHIRTAREHLSVDLMQRLHGIAFSGTKPYAGLLRRSGEEVVVRWGGSIALRGVDSKKVPAELERLVDWYNKNLQSYDPLTMAAVVHNRFLTVHPFRDGNGRVARLLLNNILIRNGLAPVDIEAVKRQLYYAALHTYQQEGNFAPTMELLALEYQRMANGVTFSGFW
jgi:Fic family protein